MSFFEQLKNLTFLEKLYFLKNYIFITKLDFFFEKLKNNVFRKIGHFFEKFGRK